MKKQEQDADLCVPPKMLSWVSQLVVLVGCYALGALPVMAEAPEPAESQPTAPAALQGNEESWRLSLKDFWPEPGPITLKTAEATQDVTIQLSERLRLTGAELNLSFSNSIALLRERSQLRVKLNGITVAQLPLDREKPRVEGVSITLPHDLLLPGYNRIAFVVAQHYTLECEDPGAPELWTEIDAVKSELVLKGTLQAINPTLAELDNLVGPAVGNPWRYRILLPPKPDENHLNAAALAAEAAGLRLNYRPAVFTHGTLGETPPPPVEDAAGAGEASPGGLGGTDTILIGTKDELKGYVAEEITGQINDAFLGVYPLTADPRYLILIVSGTTPEQVKKAALALGFMSFPFADTAYSNIKDLEIPKRATQGKKYLVATGELYRFNELGFKTATYRGGGYHASDLAFVLEPDFYVAEDENVKISLSFAYDAKMRKDSVLNLYLNGVFERAIALKNPDGDKFKDYEIFIPLRSFKPGPNVIRFEPVLVSLIHGECELVQDENLRFTLFENSYIKFPKASHYTMQPNLKLFSDTMFPYFYTLDDKPVNVAVLADDPHTLGAAWTLLAKLAQVADAPLYNLRMKTALPADEQQLIVVSPMEKIDSKLFRHMPIYKDNAASYPYPAGRVPKDAPAKKEEGVLDVVKPAQAADGKTPQELPEPINVRMGQEGLPQTHGMITAFKSPFAKDQTVTLVTAATPDTLWRCMGTLVTPDVWSQLEGDTVLWTAPTKEVAAQRAGKVFYVGNPNINELARFHLSKNPFVWVAGVFLLIILWAWLTYVLLRRRFKRRHGLGVTVED